MEVGVRSGRESARERERDRARERERERNRARESERESSHTRTHPRSFFFHSSFFVFFSIVYFFLRMQNLVENRSFYVQDASDNAFERKQSVLYKIERCTLFAIYTLGSNVKQQEYNFVPFSSCTLGFYRDLGRYSFPGPVGGGAWALLARGPF